MTEFDSATEFSLAWEAEVAKRQEKSPSYKPEEFTATGRAGKEYGGKRNAQWWADNGHLLVEKYIADRQAKPDWIIPEIDGKPAVEVGLDFEIPGLDMPIKGFIDRVFVFPTGEFAICDLKTGRVPESPEQLGLYRVGLGLTRGIWPSWGYYWQPEKGFIGPIDLTAWTPERFRVMFTQAINGINAGAFLPHPANNCKAWCGVAEYCAVVGGSKAKGADSLAV